jgi:hypothetical protein
VWCCHGRALSDQLAGPKGSPDHRALRAALVAFIRAHRGDFEPFCETEGNETFDQYVQRLGRDGVYAGHWYARPAPQAPSHCQRC